MKKNTGILFVLWSAPALGAFWRWNTVSSRTPIQYQLPL